MAFAVSDVRAAIVDTLLARKDLKAKQSRDGTVHFRCLRHDDSTPSAWLKAGSHGCMRCGFTEPLKTLAQDLGITVAGKDFTVEDYAAQKAFDAAWLRTEFQLHEKDPNGHGSVVAIPYLSPEGKVLRTKYRAGNGKMWWDREGHGIYPYGLHKLNGKPAVILCEGESDTHACWAHNVQALGIPGANTWRREFLEYIQGKDVYIWQEPDAGGDAFVRTISADIPNAKVIRPRGVKDLADLHKKEGKGFRRALQELLVQATPAGVPPIEIPFDVMLGDELNALLEKKLQPVDATPTPFPTWNQCCRDEGGGIGLGRSWHIVVAGTTGLGKSTLAVNMAYHAALAGERVTYITLEMSKAQLMTRLLAVMSGVPIRELEQGLSFRRETFEKAVQKVHEIEERNGGVVALNRRPVHKLQHVVDSIRFNYEVYGSKIFIVDYLQLAWTGKADDMNSRIIEISHEVNGCAKDLNVTTIGLSQFNRETSKADRPSKFGLMGGSSLENDADQIALLWANRDEIENTDSGRQLTLILDKNRHGPEPPDGIAIRLDKTNLRIREMLADELPSWRIG